jgi:phosphate acetyltransferase
MSTYCKKYLDKKGIDLLGVVEYSPVLCRPSLRRLVLDTKAEILNGEENLDVVPTKIMTGAGALDYILDKSSEKTLVVTPASRSDVIMAVAHIYDVTKRGESLPQEFSGLFLTGSQAPHPDVISSARSSGIPILYTQRDTYETVEAIDGSLGKTLPSDVEKFDVIDRIYSDSIDWNLFEKIILNR